MFSGIVNAAKFAQICSKLPKIAKISQNLSKDKTLKYHLKSRFQCFSKIEISTCRRGTRICFHHLGFSIQEFFICYFYCEKTAFVCEFQHTPWWKIIFLPTLYNFGEHEILHTYT
jgi:hypothetical protein